MSMEATNPLPLSVRRPTPDHPPYAEMVQFALTTLAEPNGSTESSISACIQENYTGLPWGHSKLLPYYLNKMLVAGDVKRSSLDPNFYVLPHHIAPSTKKKKKFAESSMKKKLVKSSIKNKPLGIMPETRGRGRPKKDEVNKLKLEGGVNGVDCNLENGKTSVMEMEVNDEEMAILQEKESENVGLDGVECIVGNDKSSDTKMKENGEEMVVFQEKYLESLGFNGVESNVGDDKSSCTKMKENDEEMLLLQDKDLESVYLDGVESNVGNDKSSDTKTKENDQEMSVLQAKDLDVVECNMKNDKSIDVKMKANVGELSASENDVNGKEDEMISVLQEGYCSDKERCSNVALYNDSTSEDELKENTAESLQDTPSKKSKMKTRKLWFEN